MLAKVLILVVFFVVTVAVGLMFRKKANSVGGFVLAGAFLGPFLYGLVWKRTTRFAVWASFFTGTAIPVANLFLNFASPTSAGAIAIVASLIVVPVCSLLSKKPDMERVDAIFTCYEKPVVAHSGEVLEEN